MKILRKILPSMLILFTALSCESVGLLGFGGVRGDKAKEEILAIANQTNIRIGAILNEGSSSVLVSIVIDGVIVPSLAEVRDSKYYSRPSVDHCKRQIATVGLLLGTWVGAITCDLKTTPSILQIGDGDTGSVIQLGPIGL